MFFLTRAGMLALSVFLAMTCNAPLMAASLPVRTDSGKHVIVDENGQIQATTDFAVVENFSQGFAPASDGNKWFFINTHGKKVFGQDFSMVRPFSEGLAAVCVEEKWGYVDTAGKMVIPPEFTQAFNFSEGLACVMTGKPEDQSARYGYIGIDGKYRIKPFLEADDNQFFSGPGEFKSGLAAVWLNNGDKEMPVGYINTSGEIAIAAKFGAAGEFSNGMAPVSTSIEDSDSCFGFINQNGDFLIKPSFSKAGAFSEGMAAACENDDRVNDRPGRWGYIDTKGKWIIPPMYEMAGPFSDGFAKVFFDAGENEGYIKKDGKMVCSTRILQARQATSRIIKLQPTAIKASSFMPAAKSGKIDYKPDNVMDGNIETAWIENNPGNGTGEWIEFTFAGEVKLDSMIVWNGYQRKKTSGKDPFTSNIRPAKIRVHCTDKQTDHDLNDSRGSQTIAMNQSVVSSVKIEIIATHPKNGSEDNDCGFSEIEFRGIRP